MGNATGTRKGRASAMQPMSLPTSIRGRFLKCPIFDDHSWTWGWTEDHCARLEEIAAEDHSNIATAAERARRENTWVLVLSSSGPNGPMNQREDYREAMRSEERLHQESGHANPRLHPREQVRQRPDQPCAWHDEGSERVDPKTGWRWYHHQAPLPRNGNRLRGGNLLRGGRHQVGMGESEIISLDAGLRLDGIRALDLWDLIVSVLGNTAQNRIERGDPLLNKREACTPTHTIHKRKQSQRVTNDWTMLIFISSNVNSSHQEALLQMFADNEAVIKIIKGRRSPTMRHVSRTHRVALGWLFDRINLDSKIQIKIH